MAVPQNEGRSQFFSFQSTRSTQSTQNSQIISNYRDFRDFGLATCWLVDLLACGLFLGFSLRNLGFSLRKLKKNTNSLEL